MIKLILSDLDGTLIHGDQTELPEELFREIRRLKEAGIGFCPASGRQLSSLRRLFAPIADELYYLTENGAEVYRPGKPNPVLFKQGTDRETALRLSRQIMADPDCQLLLSGDDVSYIVPKNEAYVSHIRDYLGNNTVILSDPEDIPEDILKVSLYCEAGRQVLLEAEKRFSPEWSRYYHVAVAGECWMDFTVADKGTGVDALCRQLGLQPEEIMAFGDNYNDVPMLEKVGIAYLMESAAEPLRRRFPRQCADVLEVLRGLPETVNISLT